MIFDGALGPTGDKNQRINASCNGLFGGVLNQWLINNRQHFLGTCLRRRKESGSETRNRKDGLANGFFHQMSREIPRPSGRGVGQGLRS